MRRLSIVLTATIVLILVSSPASIAADPFTGKWRLDPSKTADSNPPQITLTPITNGISLRTNQQMPFVAYYNGKDYPIGTGNTINALRINDRTLVSTTKRNGKALRKTTITVTTDGEHALTLVEGWGVEGPYKDTIVDSRVGLPRSGDAFLGTWRQDPSQTKYDPPVTYTLKVSGNKFDCTTNRAQAIRAKLNGKDYQQDTTDATLRLKRIDDHTIEMIQTNPFGPPTTSQWQVDGKMLIITSAGTRADGKPFKRIQYFGRLD